MPVPREEVGLSPGIYTKSLKPAIKQAQQQNIATNTSTTNWRMTNDKHILNKKGAVSGCTLLYGKIITYAWTADCMEGPHHSNNKPHEPGKAHHPIGQKVVIKCPKPVFIQNHFHSEKLDTENYLELTSFVGMGEGLQKEVICV